MAAASLHRAEPALSEAEWVKAGLIPDDDMDRLPVSGRQILQIEAVPVLIDAGDLAEVRLAADHLE